VRVGDKLVGLDLSDVLSGHADCSGKLRSGKRVTDTRLGYYVSELIFQLHCTIIPRDYAVVCY
jgi:hypothetical protein